MSARTDPFEEWANKEETHLAEKQAGIVLPLIGPLLDAWDSLPNDLKDEIRAYCPAFGQSIEDISEGIELLGR